MTRPASAVHHVSRCHGILKSGHARSHQSILFLHALVASVSICFVPTAPLVFSSSIASTTASPTTSTCSGLPTIAPRKSSLLPKRVLTSDPRKPPIAIGSVNFLLESYMNAGRINILRRSGNLDEIVVSASLLVVMYLLGSIGAPPAAEIYPNVGTFSFVDSCANAMASYGLAHAEVK